MPNSRTWQFVSILLVTLVTVIPMLPHGYQRGHDLDIHLASWMDASAQFRQGILYPRWASEANYGFGEPRFIFYPPTSWLLGAMLGLLLPWTLVPSAFVWLSMILAALAMRKLAEDWLPSGAALIAALVYAVNPYVFVTAYSRGACAELLASAAFPLLLWGAFRIQRDPAKSFAIVAVSLAAIWLANLPAGVIATYALALIIVIISVSLRSLQALLYGAAATLTAFGLAAFALFPAVSEKKWVNIDFVVRPKQLPWSNFLFAPNGVASMPAFNRVLSPLAALLIVAALASALSASRMRRTTPSLWWSLTVLCVLSSFLMFPVSAPIWRTLPELRFVQFPWRWLFPLCAAAAVLASFALVESRRKRMLLSLLGLGLVGVDASIVYATIAYANPAYVHSLTDLVDKFRSGRGYPGLPEYAPLAAKVDHLSPDAPLIAPAVPFPQASAATLSGVRVDIWSPERKVISADLQQPLTINLKLLAYPAWQASVNGQPATLDIDPQTGQLMLILPAGMSRTEITFGQTRDRAIGKQISIGSVIVLIAFWQLIALSRKRAVKRHEVQAVPVSAS